jgi:hypothetical protein
VLIAMRELWSGCFDNTSKLVSLCFFALPLSAIGGMKHAYS